VPAAAVIPALIAYIKVVAVKKLVVEFRARVDCRLLLTGTCGPFCLGIPGGLNPSWESQAVYFEKIRVFKAGYCLNILAWNNGIGLWCYFVGYGTEVMINRDSWGRSYFVVRGEILGFTNDELMRKHSARMFSLIKNES
jgi:hypothetical protein